MTDKGATISKKALKKAVARVPKKAAKNHAKTAGVVAAVTSALFLSLGAAGANKHFVQKIYVRNLSTFVSDKEVKNDLPAFQAATSKDFAPYWRVDAELVFIGKKTAPRGAITITLLDTSDVKNALAYHELTDGVPNSKIFVGTSKYYGYAWTVGFTHELWEQLADPSLVRTAQSFDGRIWANEIADPVEADNLGYTRPGADGSPVLISDFITDKWYGAEVAGPYDFMNHVQTPLEVLKGGYAQYWDGMTWVEITNFRKVNRPHW